MSAELWKVLGNDQFKKQNYTEAIESYSKAIALEPQNAIFYSNRSLCYLKINNLSSALQDVETCLQLDPNFIKAWIRKASILLLQQNYSDLFSYLQTLQSKKNVIPTEMLQELKTIEKETYANFVDNVSVLDSYPTKIFWIKLFEIIRPLLKDYKTNQQVVNTYFLSKSHQKQMDFFTASLVTPPDDETVRFVAFRYASFETPIRIWDALVKEDLSSTALKEFTILVSKNQPPQISIKLCKQVIPILAEFAKFVTEEYLKHVSKANQPKKKVKLVAPTLNDSFTFTELDISTATALQNKIIKSKLHFETTKHALLQYSKSSAHCLQLFLDHSFSSAVQFVTKEDTNGSEFFFELFANITCHPKWKETIVNCKEWIMQLCQLGKAGQSNTFVSSFHLYRCLANIANSCQGEKEDMAFLLDDFLINLKQGLKQIIAFQPEITSVNYKIDTELCRCIACFCQLHCFYDGLYALGFAKYLDTFIHSDMYSEDVIRLYICDARSLLLQPIPNSVLQSKYAITVQDSLFDVSPHLYPPITVIPTQLEETLDDKVKRNKFLFSNWILYHVDGSGIGKLLKFEKLPGLPNEFIGFFFTFSVVRNVIRDFWFGDIPMTKLDEIAENVVVAAPSFLEKYQPICVTTKEMALEILDICVRFTKKERKLSEEEQKTIFCFNQMYGTKHSNYANLAELYMNTWKAPSPNLERKSFSFYRSAFCNAVFYEFFFNEGDTFMIGCRPRSSSEIESYRNTHNLRPCPLLISSETGQWISETAHLMIEDEESIYHLLSVFSHMAYLLQQQGRTDLADDLKWSCKEILEFKKQDRLVQIPCVRAFLERSIFFGSNRPIDDQVVLQVFHQSGLLGAMKWMLEGFHNMQPVRHNLRTPLVDLFSEQMAKYLMQQKKQKIKRLKSKQIHRDILLQIFLKNPEVHKKTVSLLAYFIAPHISKLYNAVYESISEEDVGNHLLSDNLLLNPETLNYVPTTPAKPSVKKICNVCKKSASKSCSQCKSVYYCSRECQVSDWKTHKLQCKK